jgi:hypothetical protein
VTSQPRHIPAGDSAGHRARASASGKLEREPAAARVADEIGGFDPVGIEFALDAVGVGGGRRLDARRQRWG